MKIVGYQIFLRITRFIVLVIRPDYQKFCLRSTPVSAISADQCRSSADVGPTCEAIWVVYEIGHSNVAIYQVIFSQYIVRQMAIVDETRSRKRWQEMFQTLFTKW